MNINETDYCGKSTYIIQVGPTAFKFFPINIELIDAFLEIKREKLNDEDFYKNRSGAV